MCPIADTPLHECIHFTEELIWRLALVGGSDDYVLESRCVGSDSVTLEMVGLLIRIEFERIEPLPRMADDYVVPLPRKKAASRLS